MPALPHPDYTSIPAFRAHLDRADDATRSEALDAFIRPFHARLRERFILPRRNFSVRLPGGQDRLLSDLQRDGVATALVEPRVKAQLASLVLPFAQAVEHCVTERAKASLKACQLVLEGDPARQIGALIEQAFHDAGVYAAAAAYAGKPLRLYRIGVQVNTDVSTRARYGEIDERGLPRHPTSYLHIDSAGWPGIKALIYLTEVGADQGPFRYVAGSHRLADDFELAARKTTRKLAMPKRLFMALPEEFRLDADFGDHLDPAADDAAAALAGERTVCDGDDLILFDYSGVHRGGFVREGRRYMLQCSFKAADDPVFADAA